MLDCGAVVRRILKGKGEGRRVPIVLLGAFIGLVVIVILVSVAIPGVLGWQQGSVVGQVTAVIQRINTQGGVKPPSTECTPATLNTRRFVPYEADYYFYKEKPVHYTD